MHERSKQAQVEAVLPMRRGHFRYESGHHGALWLDLERLFLRPSPVRQLATDLALALREHDVDLVCGPLVEGAFVALEVATELAVPFTYTERHDSGRGGLFPIEYRLPRVLRDDVRGRRVAVVNDVVNAGSAVRGTLRDLRDCGAEPVAIGTLAVLGSAAAALARSEGVALVTLAALPGEVHEPADCPMCRAGEPVE